MIDQNNIIESQAIKGLELSAEYLNLIINQDRNQSANVLSVLMKELRSKGINLTYGNQQESTSEGLVYFIDRLPGRASDLFLHRYERFNICGNCNSQSQPIKGESIHFELFDPIVENFTSADQFSNYLIKKEDILPDYKCDFCHATHANTKRIELLKMASEIIVVLFNKYSQVNKSKNIFCPKSFILPGRTGPMKYIQVAQARHAGHLTGGHYWAIVSRQAGVFMANDLTISPAGALESDPLTYIAFFCLVE